ncbi:hypothetical protein UAS_01172 [Enterococcus asini ATCC 700915]|uniref:GIY-YIG domain-containing protein n=1 Tax=Enterococcus asini ATCC 700915 TaxID=1158606 RepID=R2PVH4_9ENTE|nr:GIY-YIG nuclease family protein [Enterococcus asini]EOH87228.1 hypothetical protein UAS_01172 [Enterococcus asini ATCC 700915]EOT58366.1 hypothetical protein I579_01930 [Enterococcus asini ATCC 700915]OJG10061.1 hypothetical protein RU94_GL000807 [Enterococcus asini]
MATAKIIELLLEDGTLDGLLTVQDSSWNGTMFVSPRDNINQLFQKKETSFWGIYLLLSDEGVYIGQASELQTRLKQHDKSKDFWSKCVLITTKDDSLNRSAIDYIEANLIDRAKKVEKLHIENKQNGNKTNVNDFDRVRFDNFIENALLLLELIGITVFKQEVKRRRKRSKQAKPIVSNVTPVATAGSVVQPAVSFFVELSDGFKYQGTSNKDYFLRVIEHLAKTYPNVYQDLKLNFMSKKGRHYISEVQAYSAGSNAKLYTQIDNGDFIYTNQSAVSLKNNLDQYLKAFNIQRIV